MKIILRFIKKLRSSLFPESERLLNESIPTETSNPYVAARREWNFMYGDIIKAKHNWQQIALLLLVIQFISLAGLITLALQKHFVPYVVRVDSLGNTNFTEFLNAQTTVSPLIINAMLRRYVIAARSVIADPVAQKHELDFVYGVTKGPAHTVLDNFYHVQNPFDRVKEETREVMINAVLPKSTQTWQIDWTEIQRDLNGHVTGQAHFEGLITIEQHTPTNMDEININPLGLYVTHLSWATQQ
jgi:type IV secretory pathway TrbF-like protein